MFPAVTGILDAAERHARLSDGKGVDVDHPGIEIFGSHLDRAFDILAEDAAAKAVAAVIRDAHGILIILGLDDRGDGAENLVVISGLSGGDVNQRGSGVEPALAVGHAAAGDDARTAFDAFLNLFVNLIALPLYFALLITAVGAPMVFLIVNALLIGKDLQEMVIARHDASPDSTPERIAPVPRFVLGLIAAVGLGIPFLNLVIPVIAAAMAAHMIHGPRSGRTVTA